MRISTWRTLALVGTLLLAGCGEDEGDSGSDDTNTTEKAEEKVDAAADQKLAESVVLKRDDLPAGWSEDEEDEEDAESEDEGAPGDECFGDVGLGSGTDEESGAEAESPDFSKGDFLTVGSTVMVGENETEAKVAFRVLSDDDVITCFESAMRETIASDPEEGITVTDIVTTKTTLAEVGDDATAFTMEIKMASEGIDLVALATFAFVREGRVFMMLYGVNFEDPFPPDLLADLAGKMAARADAA